jgi:hypothetical protein
LEYGADSNIEKLDPVFLIHAPTGDRYLREVDPKKVTHHMEIIRGTVLKEIDMAGGPSSSGEPEYRKL